MNKEMKISIDDLRGLAVYLNERASWAEKYENNIADRDFFLRCWAWVQEQAQQGDK